MSESRYWLRCNSCSQTLRTSESAFNHSKQMKHPNFIVVRFEVK